MGRHSVDTTQRFSTPEERYLAARVVEAAHRKLKRALPPNIVAILEAGPHGSQLGYTARHGSATEERYEAARAYEAACRKLGEDAPPSIIAVLEAGPHGFAGDEEQ